MTEVTKDRSPGKPGLPGKPGTGKTVPVGTMVAPSPPGQIRTCGALML